mmetsp:Transcript_3052/g.4418  ORF Transcript_3052/g.4418 Transcript_3052/m.4418 type:complete len:251 (+) Transcript_3052:243-995(+)
MVSYSMIKATLSALACLFAAVGGVFGVLAIVQGEWSVADVQMMAFPGPKSPPDTVITFGLYNYRASLFGDKAKKWSPYSKLQQTDDVKYLRMAGESVCIFSIGLIVCLWLYVLCGIALALISKGRYWSIEFLGERYDAFVPGLVLLTFSLLALISGTLATCFWGFSGHAASDKIHTVIGGWPAVNAEAHYGTSYAFIIVATVLALLNFALQAVIFGYKDNQSRQVFASSGSVPDTYGSFGSERKTASSSL